MSPAVLMWMNALPGLIAAAPDVIAFAGKVKQWISDMFTSNLITAEAQNQLNDRVTEICRAALNGEVPSSWQVEPDPE